MMDGSRMDVEPAKEAATATRLQASIILPAHNESGYIADCLNAVLGSNLDGLDLKVIVVANRCTDNTVEIANTFASEAKKVGCTLQIIETPVGGKTNALNLGDDTAGSGARLYLDADVIVSPELILSLVKELQFGKPQYACGTPVVTSGTGWITRAYARFWTTLPFVTDDAPGFGLFAMNLAGRAQWQDWPDVISDDTFARLQFTADQRAKLPATYRWPMVEGFANLVRVRRRQDRGVREIAEKYPDVMQCEGKSHLSFGGLITRSLRDPIGFAVYAVVSMSVRVTSGWSGDNWTRGR